MDSSTIAELMSLPNGILVVLILFGAYVMKQLRADAIKREDKLETIRIEDKEEAIKREEKLTGYIDRHAEALDNINLSMQDMGKNLSENTQAISKLSENYNNLHSRVDTIERKI